MANHPNRNITGVETVAEYIFRQSDPAMQQVSLDEVRERLTEFDTITGFEVQPSIVQHYTTDSGEMERYHRASVGREHVHLYEVVALVDGGAYGLSREGVATFGPENQAGADQLAAALNQALTGA